MREVIAAQGSREWHDARARILTASNLKKVLTPATLKPSSQMKDLARSVAVARVFGVYEDGFSSYDMQRGTELEPEARLQFEDDTDLTVDPVGLCITDDGQFGASPDGVVIGGGGLEIKCPKLSTHSEYLLEGVLPEEHRLQVQGGLFATGWTHWYFYSYYPGLPALLVRVEPDPIVQAAIAKAVAQFEETVCRVVADLEKLK